MAELLGAFLDRYAAQPHAAHRCAFYAADWLVELGWPDPAAAWRALPPRRALARVGRAGGLVAAVGPELAAIGVSMTTNPVRGDVGVVLGANAAGEAQPAAAIYLGRLWVALGITGLVAGPFETLAAWSAACPKS